MLEKPLIRRRSPIVGYSMSKKGKDMGYNEHCYRFSTFCKDADHIVMPQINVIRCLGAWHGWEAFVHYRKNLHVRGDYLSHKEAIPLECNVLVNTIYMVSFKDKYLLSWKCSPCHCHESWEINAFFPTNFLMESNRLYAQYGEWEYRDRKMHC